MQFPIVKEYKTDIQAQNPENWVEGEPISVPAGAFNKVVALRHAPFFTKGLRVATLSGEPLVLGKDYQIFQIMGKMTQLTASPVACMIEIINPNVLQAKVSYHVVGEFSLVDNALLQLIANAINDDRPIYWDNLTGKPSVFPPELHGHSILYEVVAYQDMVDFFGHLADFTKQQGRTTIEIKIEHYYKLIQNYTKVFGDMLRQYLANHQNAYNAHGLTAAQVLLEKVDNFATASVSQALQPRLDLHVTPLGLKAIVDTYGIGTTEFLEAGVLPLSQVGNTNFIPPSIDGSFEGIGSRAETCAICLERDGKLTLLGNRFDGRVNGLYFSVMDPGKDFLTPKQTFSAYRYNHPKFIQDGVNVDMVVQGSGKDVIMVGDSKTQTYYLGASNGTLDPSKHVYCKINVEPILKAVFSDITVDGQKPSDYLFRFSLSVMGDWVYICFSHWGAKVGDVNSWGSSCDYKHLWRVPFSSIRLLKDLTPVRQNVTFVDLDGKQWTNSTTWRWGTRTVLSGNGQRVSRYLYNFSPAEDLVCRIIYAQPMLSAQNPQTGKWAVKFQGYFYMGNNANAKAGYSHVEVVNEFDPETGIMKLLAKPKLTDVNFATWDPNRDSGEWAGHITSDQSIGMTVLEDGTLITTHTSSAGYPWYSRVGRGVGILNRYQMIANIWRDGIRRAPGYDVPIIEEVIPPVASSINPKPPFQFPTGELYVTAGRTNKEGYFEVFFKAVTGRYQARPGLTNLVVGQIVGRPLSNNIKRVNMQSAMGGSIVSVPSSNLNTYGIEVGASALCMNVQRKTMDREAIGKRWGDSGGQDDIILIDTHDLVQETDGTLSVVPTSEILYPASIISQLKQQVELVSVMNASPRVVVSINDPTGYLTDKFGYLPVIVGITYVRNSDKFRFNTFMTILPTYSTSGNRRTVTGFTVIDKGHYSGGTFEDQTATTWNCWVTGQTTADPSWVGQPMRTHYYLNADGSLDVHMDPAVQSPALGDVVGRVAQFRIPNRATRRWSNFVITPKSVNNQGYCCTPDNGIAEVLPVRTTTGGAGVIANGGTNKPLLVSVYPETGWAIFFQNPTQAVFRGRSYTLASGILDLRDVDSSPANKTFYLYALLKDGKPVYEVTTEKRLESDFQLWVAEITTNATQIVSVDRFNVLALDGHRISEVKRGNSIPASSGLVNEEGQIPWIRSGELLP